MNFEFEPQAIPEVILVKPKIFNDARGFFLESYKKEVFKTNGITVDFMQENRSRSSKGTLRGLHYQLAPHAQAKLFSVNRGEVIDVAVDIRKGSPTYGQWVSAILSDENQHQLYVPEGFAHGFYVRSEIADVSYKVNSPYMPSADSGIRWNDPTIGLDWQIEAGDTPLLSDKDAQLAFLEEASNNFEYST